jgi:putative membrane protein
VATTTGATTTGATTTGATTAGASAQQAAPSGDLPAVADSKLDTATFAKTFASANRFEIDSSKLAEDKGVAADVKAFAALMIEDHTKAAEDFKAALQNSQTTGSVTPDGASLMPDHQAILDQLKALDGDAFQARYIAAQTEAHKQAVALFSTYAQSGDDPALKEFAKKTLETLKMHEMRVRDLAAAH